MSEHPEHPADETEIERERRESTDLGYRDTEEERAYEEAESPASSTDASGTEGESGVGGG